MNKEVEDLGNFLDGKAIECSPFDLAEELYSAGYRKIEGSVEQFDDNKNLYELELTLFMVVRNSAVLPLGLHLKKTEKEITDKTFETIECIKKQIDYKAAEKFYNLREKK